jgi:hypothetical protein
MRYTTIIAAAVALVAAPLAVHAQDVGVVGGLSFGNVSNAGVLPGDVGVRTGFTAGVSAFTPGAVGVGIQGLYSQRGVSSQAGARSRELEYLDVPVLLRVRVPTSGIAPYVYAGPQMSWELKCNAGSGKCPRGDRPKAPWAGIVGAGLQLGGASAVTVEARYIYGLQDLELDTVTDSDNYAERSFMILAGIAF